MEKAKTTTRKAVSKLGKLQITLPESARRCLHTLKIIRVSDGKLLKKVEDPKADGTHPLPAGKYEVIAGYADSNYRPDSEVSLGVFDIKGGETAQIKMGAMAINLADSLQKIPAGGDKAILRIEPASNGDHPLWYPYAVPPGTYDLMVFPEGMTEPLPAGEGLTINKGELLQFDAGI